METFGEKISAEAFTCKEKKKMMMMMMMMNYYDHTKNGEIACERILTRQTRGR